MHRTRPTSLTRLTALSAASAALLLAGCNTGALPRNFGVGNEAGSLVVRGNIYGGQQPVSGATLQLYTVGTTGLASASTNLLTSAVTSDAGGNFSLTGKYSCSAATQVYLVATGGDPGAGTNSALSMAAALGDCATLLANANTTFISLNEVTTVAAAYALAPFATDAAHIGATGSNPAGLVAAFANASALANTASGSAPGTVPANTVVPTAEINTLADILASCINTTGAASAQCTQLFSVTGATDTFSAAVALARNPAGTAVSNLYSLVTAASPFQPTLSTQPADFALALQYAPTTALSAPNSIALDSIGNAWISNSAGSLVHELSNSGAQLRTVSGVGFGTQGIAVDRTDKVWVAGTLSNALTSITPSGSTYSTAQLSTGTTAPVAVAIDASNRVWVTNFNGNSVSAFTPGGVALSGSPFTASGNLTLPASIAIAADGSPLVASSNGTVVKLTPAGAYASTLSDNALQGTTAVTTDPTGRVYAAGFTTGSAVAGSLASFTAAGAAASNSPVSSLAQPQALATDGTSVWIADSTRGLVRSTFNSTQQTPLIGGAGSLSGAQGLAVDFSGSVWVTNAGNNTISKFIGLAAPVLTPLAANLVP